jgi:catalase-peroxidase
VPEPQPWQDPVPAVDHPLIDEQDIARLKGKILDSGLVRVSATGFDRLGIGFDVPWLGQAWGANGARVRFAPQKDWEVNEPAQLAKVLEVLEAIQQEFNGAQAGGKKVSLAD